MKKVSKHTLVKIETTISKVAENKLSTLKGIVWDWASFRENIGLKGTFDREPVEFKITRVFSHKPIYQIFISGKLIAQGSNYDDVVQIAELSLIGYSVKKSK